jgi:hypothetical protein
MATPALHTALKWAAALAQVKTDLAGAWSLLVNKVGHLLMLLIIIMDTEKQKPYLHKKTAKAARGP